MENATVSVTWKIENLSILLRKKTYWLISPRFQTSSQKGIQSWKLEVAYFSAASKLAIKFRGLQGQPLIREITMSVVGSDGEIQLNRPVLACKNIPRCAHVINNLTMSNTQRIAPDNILTIVCNIPSLGDIATVQHVFRTVLTESTISWNVDKQLLGDEQCGIRTVRHQGSAVVLLTMFRVRYATPTKAIYSVMAVDLAAKKVHERVSTCSFLRIYIPKSLGRVLCETDKYLGIGQGWYIQIEEQVKRDLPIKLTFVICKYENQPDVSALEVAPEDTITLEHDFLNLYPDYIFGDVRLKANGESFPARPSSAVRIDNMDSETVERMLVLMYSHSVGDLTWRELCMLYIAADRFQNDKLRQRCGETMRDGFNVAKACISLQFLYDYDDELLSKFMVDFTRYNEEFFSSAEWECLEKKKSFARFKSFTIRIFKTFKGLIFN